MGRGKRTKGWLSPRAGMPRGALLPAVLFTLLVLIWITDPDRGGTTAEVITAARLSVVDGDTVRLDGARIRLTGYDTPETYRADCEEERKRGEAATARLRVLLRETKTVELARAGARDRHGRELARLFLDGRDVADIMVGEGLARHYQGGKRSPWCN